MPKYLLVNLGAIVKKHRGAQKLRETAEQIGISAPTLLRVESGRMPDLETFGKICRWLNVDPGDFLGKPATGNVATATEPTVSAHFKAEKTPQPETLNALARMLLLIVNRESKSTSGV